MKWIPTLKLQEIGDILMIYDISVFYVIFLKKISKPQKKAKKMTFAPNPEMGTYQPIK